MLSLTTRAMVAWLLAAGLAAAAENGSQIGAARRLLLRGRYEEAAERYEQAGAEHPVAAAVGLARCRQAVGQRAAADTLLAETIQRAGRHPDLLAERAMLALEAGRHDSAGELARGALAEQPDHLAARWVVAELARLTGQVDAAADGYSWLAKRYAPGSDLPPEHLRIIGWAAAQHARWTRDSRQFQQLVRDLYPECLRRDPDYWPARYETGLLLLEKYNAAEARVELQAALAINPRAAEVHAALAALALQSFGLDEAEASLRRALEIDGQLLAAHRLQADRLLAELRAPEAIQILEQARPLNPVDEETLGRLAAAYGLADGWQTPAEGSRLGALLDQVTAGNPHCGAFYLALADSLDLARRYPQAARYYREALQRLPQLMYARGRLGLVLMRLGEEAEAGRVLEESFAEDPFNVRVKNMLEVCDVLQGYAVLETDHFVLRFDGQRDELLARYAARYLEEQVYPEIVEELGFEPPGKSLFEFFCRARNSSGHAWFSARMVGLPFVGTVGACAGGVVAIASPTDMPQPYNWARVLRHEFVHVVNLQQTDYNVPHWFTEALAVRLEGTPRPGEWTQALVAAADSGELLDLQTINAAFIRPRDHQQWTLAYCQAELYAEFMHAHFGSRAVQDLLQAYAQQLDTPAAIQQCFQVDQPEFERRYREFLEPLIRAGSTGPAARPRSVAELLRSVEQQPQDADAWAELGRAYLGRGDNLRARRCASSARELQADHPLAAYVLARLYLSIGDAREAIELLEPVVRVDRPQRDALALLAGLQFQAGQLQEAERLYQRGAECYPHPVDWLKSLTRVYLKSGDQRKLRAALEKLAELEPDSLAVARKLVELWLAEEDPAAVARWARRVQEIDVADAEAHQALGWALARTGRPGEAAEEFQVAIGLDPNRPAWYLAWVRACLAAGQPEDARRVLRDLLERFPGDEEGRELLGELSGGGPGGDVSEAVSPQPPAPTATQNTQSP